MPLNVSGWSGVGTVEGCGLHALAVRFLGVFDDPSEKQDAGLDRPSVYSSRDGL